MLISRYLADIQVQAVCLITLLCESEMSVSLSVKIELTFNTLTLVHISPFLLDLLLLNVHNLHAAFITMFEFLTEFHICRACSPQTDCIQPCSKKESKYMFQLA